MKGRNMLSEFEINRIYMEYQPKILKYLMYKTNSRDLAEDLCSDVFMKLLKKADSFDETKSSVSTWIYTIARNTLYDYFRTRHVTEELDEEIREESDVEESLCNEETMQELAGALKKLDERERDLILLQYYGGNTLKDIAERMGISYSYAKILHKKALDHLKQLMG
ncbi:MAG: hypothetical protein CW338_11950 [Clostridiales bacterium]|nr:hypothetical protein [Clostridiales bacterium]